MATTQNTYTGDGSTSLFSFTFPYIDEADVNVTVDGTATTAYSFANATTIQMTTAPATGAAIRIFRDTDSSVTKAAFFAGSAIRSRDLNDNFTQSLYISQESQNVAAAAETKAEAAETSSVGANTNATAAAASAATATAQATAAAASSATALAAAQQATTDAAAAQASASAAATSSASAAADAAQAATDSASSIQTANGAVTTANAASAASSSAVTTATSSSNLVNTYVHDGTNPAGDGVGSNPQGLAYAINTANSASANASAAVTTANQSNATASTALTNSQTAVSDSATALSNSQTAITDSAAAVSTSNTASTNASNAVTSANTANTTSNNALSTVNQANTNATAALNNSRESDGQGGFVSAITKANTAISTANAASNAVSNAVLFDLVTNVSNIPSNPSNNDYAEVGDSTGIQNFTPLTGLPSGFTGASGLTVRLRYDSSQTSWVYMSYFANDSEDRYVAKGTVNPTYFANQAAFPSATTYHGGVAHSHSDGAMYYAHGGNWIELAKDSDVTTNATNIATNTSNISSNTTAIGTKLPLAGGTLTGNLTLNGSPSSTNMAATKGYVDTQIANLSDSAPSTLNTLNELAAALGDDANFSTTVTNSIAAKMPLAGGTFTGNVDFNDNVKARFGASNDLQIYHDGSDSFITGAGTGFVYLQNTTNNADVILRSDDGSGGLASYVVCDGSTGETKLYYYGANKLLTKSDGVDINGELQCDSLDVDGNADINGQVGFKSAPTSGRTLEVESSSSAGIRIKNSSAASGAYLNFWDSQNSGATQNYLGCVGNDLVYKPNGSEVFRVTSSGNATYATGTSNVQIFGYGKISAYAATSNNNPIYEGYSNIGGSNTRVFKVTANGSAEFDGTITAGGFNLSSLTALP